MKNKIMFLLIGDTLKKVLFLLQGFFELETAVVHYLKIAVYLGKKTIRFIYIFTPVSLICIFLILHVLLISVNYTSPVIKIHFIKLIYISCFVESERKHCDKKKKFLHNGYE